MTTFVASMLISLDGRNANSMGVPDLEEHEEFNQLFARSDSIVFDRADYELLIPYWDDLDITDPDVDEVEREFARIFRTKPRIVVADDLEQVDSKSELINTDAMARLTAMKQEEHGTVLLSVGTALLTAMLAHNLVDEFHVMMRPWLLGGDDSPLKGPLSLTTLALLESRVLTSGTLVLRYLVLEPTPEID